MGNRANVFFVDDETESQGLVGIYLYSHWMGLDLQRAVLEVLQGPVARRRWGDPSYLHRIIIHNLLADHGDASSDTGFGLSTFLTDNSYPILVIEADKQEVRLMTEGDERSQSAAPLAKATFESCDTLLGMIRD